MKKHITIAALALAGIAAISSCSKKSSSTPAASPYTVTATKGSTTVTASGQSNVYAVLSGPLLEVVGATIAGADTTGFIFVVSNYTGAGAYNIDGMTNIAEYVTKTGSTGSVILGTSGTLTITSAATPYMKGTFSFSDGTTSITNGSFTAHF